MRLADLNQVGKTFVIPADEDLAWYGSVSLLASGTYGTERNGPPHGEHHRDTRTSPSDIASDLIIWLAARDYPGRPAQTKPITFEHALVARLLGERPHLMPCQVRRRGGLWPAAV